MNKPQVLAACTTAIGDTILCTPALIILGHHFKVDVLAHQYSLPLLQHNPFLHRLYPYRNNQLFRLYLALILSMKRYYRLLIMHANDDLMKLLPWLQYEKAANIQGWHNNQLRINCLDIEPSIHLIDQRIKLAEWAGGVYPFLKKDHSMYIFLTQNELTLAEKWLEDKGLPHQKPRVGLVLGASHIFKCWPKERFGMLARALIDRGIRVVILGKGHEINLAKNAQMIAKRNIAFGHQLNLRLLGAILSRLDLLISNDTGPLHFSQAVKTPVLGLFGPTDPLTIGPRETIHRVIKAPITCTPCLTKNCLDGKCMQAIETDYVLEVALKMLAKAQFSRKERK